MIFFGLGADFTIKLFKKEASYQRLVYSVLKRYQSEWSKKETVEVDMSKMAKDKSQIPVPPEVDNNVNYESQIRKYRSSDDDLSDSRWKLELAWLTKALEPALQLCRRALPTGLFIAIAILSNYMLFMHFPLLHKLIGLDMYGMLYKLIDLFR